MDALLRRKNCLNCFYCSKAHRSPDHGEEVLFSLTEKERQAASKQDFSFVKPVVAYSPYLRCKRGKWDEAIANSDANEIRASIKRLKCKNYLYFRKAEGMNFTAAIQEQANSEKNYKERVMFWLAALSLVASTIAAVASVLALSTGR